MQPASRLLVALLGIITFATACDVAPTPDPNAATADSPTPTTAPPAPTTSAAPTPTTAPAPPVPLPTIVPSTTAAPTTSTTLTPPPIATTPPTTTTVAPTTTSTTVPATTTSPPPTTASPTQHFSTLAPGASLPSGEWCANHVSSAPETRSGNAGYNNTRGTTANDRYPRVDGDFTGTTDEIIQWAACKWGIDEDIARAQAAKESWWHMTAGGDLSSNQNDCHPDLRTNNGADCPESIGLLQVRWLYHSEAFEDANAIESTAYNADYTWAMWRDCYDGNLTWLNDVDRGATYEAGDVDGCLGVWFTGRWRVSAALTYIDAVHDLLDQRVWEQSHFLAS